jgi:hypothetical protein
MFRGAASQPLGGGLVGCASLGGWDGVQAQAAGASGGRAWGARAGALQAWRSRSCPSQPPLCDDQLGLAAARVPCGAQVSYNSQVWGRFTWGGYHTAMSPDEMRVTQSIDRRCNTRHPPVLVCPSVLIRVSSAFSWLASVQLPGAVAGARACPPPSPQPPPGGWGTPQAAAARLWCRPLFRGRSMQPAPRWLAGGGAFTWVVLRAGGPSRGQGGVGTSLLVDSPTLPAHLVAPVFVSLFLHRRRLFTPGPIPCFLCARCPPGNCNSVTTTGEGAGDETFYTGIPCCHPPSYAPHCAG